MEQKNSKWKEIKDVQQTFEIDKVELCFGFDKDEQPIVKRFELYQGEVKIKYEPMKFKREEQVIQGQQAYRNVIVPVYFGDIPEVFPLYKELKEKTAKDQTVKCSVLVTRMITKEGETFYKLKESSAKSLVIEEQV